MTIWEPNSPPSLVEQCARNLVSNQEAFKDTVGAAGGLNLPAELVEVLFTVAQEQGVDLGDSFLKAFKDLSHLTRVSARDSSVSDRGLKYLLRHRPREVDIHNCSGLTVTTLHNINNYSENLLSLSLGSSVQILPDYLQPEGTFSDSDCEDADRDGNIHERQGYIIKAPKLRRLVITDLFINRGPNYFYLLLKPLPSLVYLDLSGAFHNQGMGRLDWLLDLPNLASLVLHDVKDVEQALPSLCQLTRLKHLDISQRGEPRGCFSSPEEFMTRLVRSLPELRSLDISGTNLAGKDWDKAADHDPAHPCDIAGLSSRVDRPLDFLGLYKTHDNACDRQHIPAREVSGDSCEAQILVAGKKYLDRPQVLENILNDLFHVFRYQTCADLHQALDILLLAMERHSNEKHIQISGSASLYYVVKSNLPKKEWNVKVKRKILTVLLNGMLNHKEDPTMMRNGCLTLCQFQIPQDVLFDYERLVKILLHIVSEHTSEENNFIQRAGIFLLNSLACQVDGQQKMLVGSLGAIEKMLGIITDRLQSGVCDDVMETAWSTLWNVTDETPSNCKRFLDGRGMYLFLKCKERFPEKAELLRNMMGLLGNVAEVPELRHKLMTREFVDEFAFLLDSHSDGIEVSYNAAGVLAHMASDGEEAWTIKHPERAFVLERMVNAINRWNLNSQRNINYRSFSPIISLLGVWHTPECQLWAAWALANLTTVTPDKYCSLVEAEGGLAMVEEILNENHNADQSGANRKRVKELAEVVRSNVVVWKGKSSSNLEFDG